MAIVVGYLPTEEGRTALRHATIEARLRETTLIIVRGSGRVRDFDTQETARLQEEWRRMQADLDAEGIGYEQRSLTQGNDLSDDLISVAQEVDAELIVIGLRRRRPVGKLLLGSNAQRILLEASCPVLAVKAAGR